MHLLGLGKVSSSFGAITGSLPPVPGLGTQLYKQAACNHGNPGPEEEVSVPPRVDTNANERHPY